MSAIEKICSKVCAAAYKYDMIDENDCIAIGVSGGKDSLVLLYALKKISMYYPKHFTIKAFTLDAGMGVKPNNYEGIEKLCEELEIEYIIKRTNLAHVVFEERKEKNPCSMCAKMRRGILHKLAKENGCNKIALGHHCDDAIQTFLMNLLNGGTIGCFSPKSYLSNRELWLIRPLIYCSESEIKAFSENEKLPVVKSNCPYDGITQRQKTADLIEALKKDYPDLKSKIFGAMERSGINGFKK